MIFLIKVPPFIAAGLYILESSFALPLLPRDGYEDGSDLIERFCCGGDFFPLPKPSLAPPALATAPAPPSLAPSLVTPLAAKPRLPTPKPGPRAPKPHLPSPKPGPRAPKPCHPAPKPRHPAPKPGPRAPKPRLPAPKLGPHPPKPRLPAPKPGPRAPKPRSPVPKPKTDCSISPAKSNKTRRLTRVKRAINYIRDIFARDRTEFIGFHGTNSETATLWTTQNFISKPPSKENSFLDTIRGILSAKGGSSGSSGADAELGVGLYVTDDPEIAHAFAENNAKMNEGSTPKVCAIFSQSSASWRSGINKVFLPEDAGLIGDSGDAIKSDAFEGLRQKYINSVRPGAQASTTVRFSLLDRKRKTGQLVLPTAIGSLFQVQCFDFDKLPENIKGFQEFSYNSQRIRSEWEITPENKAAAECVTG